jgi:hypothetical protein
VGISIFSLSTILVLVIAVIIVFTVARIFRRLRRAAVRAGYSSVKTYLQSPPRSDREKRDAVDLALSGLIICLLGLLFPPFLLVGILPLYYGSRKTVYASLGLGLVDDEDEDQNNK